MPLSDICAAAGIQPACSMQHTLFQAGVVIATSCDAAAEAAEGLDIVLVLLQDNSSSSSSSSSSSVSEAYLLYNTGLFTREGAELMAHHLQVCTDCHFYYLIGSEHACNQCNAQGKRTWGSDIASTAMQSLS
jgi:hypothetical protein